MSQEEGNRHSSRLNTQARLGTLKPKFVSQFGTSWHFLRPLFVENKALLRQSYVTL
jgi:hypothetical protein